MGLTISSENIKCSSVTDRPTVRVITPDGSLREFTTPVSASDPFVNAGETHFLCNSDTLYFDSEITTVGPTELLQPGQLYFLLPISMQGNVLSGIDMAALAVKASSALAQSNSRRPTSSGNRRVHVAPDSVQLNENINASKNAKLNQRINEDTVMISGTRSSVAATAAVKAVKKARTPGRKGPRALRRQLSIILEVVE